ncbi:Sushi, von Willebrand factor type A, EGF and pentraxin domain-containing protein 1 [Orchesella cincta]|uniref:Sushi, von Willebrand factor type A, EGF and pentraxin domain-containing protein 1 n=1 Tax=Orchesella cincta TaxID=48709 RepID=A0A1D2NDN1_ORCCI|nr:Sushi, von Willebrand factor type A, EGF and pentraxin domain-containing protein 1 [Orchesella cincta]
MKTKELIFIESLGALLIAITEKECLDPEPPIDLGDVQASGKVFGSKATYSVLRDLKLLGWKSVSARQMERGQGRLQRAQRTPPLIDHARHNAPVGQTTFDLDTSLMYQCLPGYTTKGFARTKCFFYNGTAKWFGPDITCEPKSCGDPQDILNGSKEKSCVHVGCEISYVCQPGFELVGRAKHTCQPEGIWLPKDLPTCVPVHCPDLEHPANGKVMYTSTTFNSPATYECKYGYMLVGESTRRCGPNKRWSGTEPQCKEINCGSPGILYNGWLDGSRMTLHAVIEFHCLEGMTFDGENERTVCQSDGTWSTPFPKCYEINCGHPGQLPNGWLENIEKGTALGASVIFRCKEGMTLVGHTSSLCQVDGQWRYPPPNCFAPCQIPVVAFGNVTSKKDPPEESTVSPGKNETEVVREIHKPGATVPHGKIVDILCENRYEPSQSLSPPQCFNGTFTQAPRCQPARCKSLPRAPKHGMVIAPKTGHGMRARFTCKDGYTLVGHNVTECQYGDWIGETPNCVQVFCKFPGSIPNGRVLLVGNMGLYDYRNYVTKVANNRQIMFECDKGFVLADGPIGKTCIRGEWSPKIETPKCVPSQHPNFRWMRKRRKRSIGGIHRCKKQQQGGGGGGGAAGARRNRKRGRGGEEEDYDAGPFGCERLDEEPNLHSTVVQGAMNENQTYNDGTIMKIGCLHGFELNMGNDSIKCKNGAWRPKSPRCNALPCKTPYIQHGTFSDGSKTLYFQEVLKHSKAIHFRCSKGYQLKGSNKMMCWYGEWDVTDIPECMPAPCKLMQIKYGAYSGRYRAGNIVIHGTELDYTCGGDFKKVDQGSIRCHLGEWKPSKPACTHPSSLTTAAKTQNHSTNAHHIFTNYREYDLADERGTENNKRRSVWLDLGIQTQLDSHGKRPCVRPPKERGSILYFEGRPLDFEMEYSFVDSSEILYRCANGKPKTKSRWKIICADGTWTKNNNFSCEGSNPPASEIKELIKLINSSCLYNKEGNHVVTFSNEHQLIKDHYDFPPASTLISRCEDIGKFILKGAAKRKCISGQWLGVTPKCEGLSQFHDLSLDKPPTILFRYVNGSIMQSSDGKLIVYPGTTLHMECLWIRKFGSPKWEISNSEREYAEGWAEEEGRDSFLEYRLTIENAETEDSGIYRCVTPARQAHQIVIVVKGKFSILFRVECPKLPENTELAFSTLEVKLGTRVSIQCKSGDSVVGAKEVTCLPSGKWSSPLPRCKGLECPEISSGADLVPLRYMSSVTNRSYDRDEMVPPKVSIHDRFVGGKAVFSCPSGYMVQGNAVVICQSSGQWSSTPPTCIEVECRPPLSPKNGYLKGTPPYKIGDTVQFECEHGYMIDGTPIINCQKNGKWSSSPSVKCLQVCTYPGSIIGGKSSPVKFYYAVGEKVYFECDEDYEIGGARMLQCLGNGKWSTTIPTCIPSASKNDGSNFMSDLNKQRKSKRTN